jgi:hypothetical protein
MNGRLAAGGTNTVDSGKVDTTYRGAHFIGFHYNQNLLNYADIQRGQQQSHAKRVLVLVGVAHVGVVEELLAANPAQQVVHAATHLKTNKRTLLRLANIAL